MANPDFPILGIQPQATIFLYMPWICSLYEKFAISRYYCFDSLIHFFLKEIDCPFSDTCLRETSHAIQIRKLDLHRVCETYCTATNAWENIKSELRFLPFSLSLSLDISQYPLRLTHDQRRLYLWDKFGVHRLRHALLIKLEAPADPSAYSWSSRRRCSSHHFWLASALAATPRVGSSSRSSRQYRTLSLGHFGPWMWDGQSKHVNILHACEIPRRLLVTVTHSPIHLSWYRWDGAGRRPRLPQEALCVRRQRWKACRTWRGYVQSAVDILHQ